MHDDDPGNQDPLDRLIGRAATFPTNEARLLSGVRRRLPPRGPRRLLAIALPAPSRFLPGLALASALAVTPFAVARLSPAGDPALSALSAIALGDPFAAGAPFPFPVPGDT